MSSLKHGTDKLYKYTVVMITKEGSNKIVNFMTPGERVLVLGHRLTVHIVKIFNFFKIYFSTAEYRSYQLSL